MAQTDKYQPFDDLDAFFDAAATDNAEEIHQAAKNLAGREQGTADAEAPAAQPSAKPASATAVKQRTTQGGGKAAGLTAAGLTAADLPLFGGEAGGTGKFIAIDPSTLPGSERTSDPFVLIPANIHSHVPLWGWATIAAGLLMMIVGVVLTPVIRLNRTVARLGDSNQATVQNTMRQLVMNGDRQTAEKLYDVAAAPREKMTVRLRAVDTMALIERVPEVDRLLLRLELATETTEQIREAAVAARKQREAYRTRVKP